MLLKKLPSTGSFFFLYFKTKHNGQWGVRQGIKPTFSTAYIKKSHPVNRDRAEALWFGAAFKQGEEFIVLGLLQQFLNILYNFVRCSLWSITLHNLSFLINKEFGEIPFNSLGAEQTWCFLRNMLE
ncbi:hypothetical protein DFQ00_11917 [Paenibacillus barcinonensis]|uniref:Uncharacterized protein n=1 Tax=Paenibacillus barcinonensis TaxID=198119 RepID=A0A2V4VHE5_PAEBA|nr:hypothetical protein DFQ00_11917 [Paenibacillus barcinonensis]